MTQGYYHPDLDDTEPTLDQIESAKKFYARTSTQGFKTVKAIENNTSTSWAENRDRTYVNGFSNTLEVEHAVARYFFQTDEAKEAPTIPGLALALNFVSVKEFRAAMDKYDKKDPAATAMARAMISAVTQVEEVKNRILLEGGKRTQAVIFDLKNNHEWADKIEQTHTMDATDGFQEFIHSLKGSVLRPKDAASFTDPQPVEKSEPPTIIESTATPIPTTDKPNWESLI